MAKWAGYSIKNTDGNFIYNREIEEAILKMVGSGKSTNIDGKKVTIVKEEIIEKIIYIKVRVDEA